VKTQLDAIERALVFLVVCELGWLRLFGEESSRQQALELVQKTGGNRVSMGAWLELARRLAALMPSADSHPVVRAARQLVNDSGKPSELCKQLQEGVVPLRNNKTHGVAAAEETIHELELPLREHWKQLKAALGSLRELQLVTRAKLKDFNLDDGRALYNVRQLTGGSEHFPIAEITVRGKLDEHWGYLVGPGESQPLPLSPLLRLRYNTEAGRREVMMPRTLVLDPGKKVELCQRIGDQTEKVAVP
jgi:hypothetical protein